MRVRLDVDEVAEARPVGVRAAGRDIVLVRWHGRVFAVRDVCPHMSCGLAGGRVRARMYGHEVGDMETDDDTPVIECPWHNFAYDLHTGLCYADRTLRVRTYPVSEESGALYVDMER
jgi:nitrite reductase/ring-hydroxylating ferredoxin subunit